MKKALNYLIRKFGLVRKNKEYCYDFEKDAQDAISIIRLNTMVSYEPLVTLFQQVQHCEINNVPGDFVECGVWKGGSVGLMALANIKFSEKKRHIHMFDIFDDICEPDPLLDGLDAIGQVANLAKVPTESLQGRLKPVKGVYDSHGGHGTVEIVKQLLENKIKYEKKFVHYYEGWFQNTLPKYQDHIEKIAILRLDADLYASTKVCLEFLFKKVVPGGFVIIDDYGAYVGCKKAVNEFRDKQGITSFMVHVNRDCRYWIKE